MHTINRMRGTTMHLYIIFLALFSLVAANNTNYMTIDCSVLGTPGCEQVKAIAIMLDQGKTLGPNAMLGDTTIILAIVLAATLAAVLLLVALVVISRRVQTRKQRKQDGECSNDDNDDDTDKTFVNSRSTSRSGKHQSGKDEEVLFRLSMSPY